MRFLLSGASVAALFSVVSPAPSVARNAVRQALPGHNNDALGTATGDTPWTATYINESGAPITTASLVFVGWRLTASGYAAVGNDVPTTATITYNGSNATLTSGGSATILIPNDGQIVTDAVALGFSIPAGAAFTVAGTQTLANDQKYARSGSVNCGIAGVRTHVTDSSSLKSESLFFMGDSIMTNNGAAVLTASAGKSPCVGHSIGGTKASDYNSGFARTTALFQALGCTTMVSNFGTNALGTAAVLIAQLTPQRDAIRAINGQYAHCTLLPRATSLSVTVSSLTSVGTTATATVPDASKFIVGYHYSVSGANEAAYNGGVFIESRNLTTNTVTFAFPGNSNVAATGTITLRASYASRELMVPHNAAYGAGAESERGQFNAWVRAAGNVDSVIDWGDAVEVVRDDGLWPRGGDKPEMPSEFDLTVASSPTSTTTVTYFTTAVPTVVGISNMITSGTRRGTRLSTSSNVPNTGISHGALATPLSPGDVVRIAPMSIRATDDGVHPRSGVGDNSSPSSKGGQLLLVNETKRWLDQKLRGAVSANPTASSYITPVSTGPYAAYGAQRIIPGYSGPLFQLRSASGAITNISPALGGDYPDLTAINAWAVTNGGGPLTIPTIYDQTGNGQNLTQANVANQPSFDPASPTGYAAPILIDGFGASGPNLIVEKTPQTGNLSLDLISNTFFLSAATTVSQNGCGYVEFTSEDGATVYQALHSNAQAITLRNGGANESTNSAIGPVPQVRNTVFGASNSASQSVIYANGGRRSTGHTRTSQIMPRIRFGTSAAGGSGYNGKFKLFAAVFYSSTLSSSDGDAVVASLEAATAIPTNFTHRVVFDGDSIMEGSGSTLLQNMVNQLGLPQSVEVFNTAVHGQSLSTIHSGRVARFASLYTTSRPCVFFVQAGINDIGNGISGANLYANSTVPLVAYLRGLGYKVVVCTLLPFAGSTNWSSAKEAERVAYNSLVVENTAGAEVVLNLASDPIMGASNAPADTNLYADRLHPANAGYARLATLYKPAIDTAINTVAAPPVTPPFSISDTFTGTGGSLPGRVADSGGTWITHPQSSSDISSLSGSGSIYQPSSQAGIMYVSTTPTSANYRVEADIIVRTLINSTSIGPLGRLSSSALTYYGARYTAAGQVILFKSVAGTLTTLGTYDVTFPVGEIHKLAIVMNGDQISAEVDGVTRIGPVTDSSITDIGFVGTRIYGLNSTPTTGPHIDALHASLVNAAPALAALNMSQLSEPKRIYQRSTTTGGGAGKGQGTVPIAIAPTSTTPVYARVRSSDGSTILQASWQVSASVSAGSQTLNVTGVDAREGWFYIDLSTDNTTWANGTVQIGMGRLIGMSGQSLVVLAVGREEGDNTTITSVGVTPSVNSAARFSYVTDGARTYNSPTWQVPGEGTPYDGAFVSEYLRLQVAAAGVNCGLIGHAVSGESIATFQPGGAHNAALRNRLATPGGFEAFIWFHGHTDIPDSSGYSSSLNSLFADVTSQNTIRGSNYEKYVGTIPNITATDEWGTEAQVQQLRNIGATWASNNSAVYVQPIDLALSDGTHQTQAGSVKLARHFHRASRPALGLVGDHTGPTISSATRAAGSAAVVLNMSMPSGATTLTAVGSPHRRFKVYVAGTFSNPLAFAASNQLVISGTTITLNLATAPANNVALDVYAFSPYDYADNGATDLIYDNHTDGDGLTQGRPVMASLTPTTVAIPAASLNALGGTFTLAESASSGATAGTLTGVTAGSSLSLADNAGGSVALSGNTVVRGATALDFETNPTPSFTVRETLAGASNSPRDTVFTLSVTNSTEVTISGTPGAATQNTAYSFTPTAANGWGTKTFALTGTLPNGLSFSTTTGAITGTPTVAGTTSGLNISVSDSSGTAALGSFSIVVAAAAAPVQLGPNLTKIAASPTITYGAGRTGFGQEMKGGFAKSATATDVMPTNRIWTVEAVVSVTNAQRPPVDYAWSFASQLNKFWMGVAPDGRLIAAYTDVVNNYVFIGGGDETGGGSLPIISDGTRKHIAMVASATGVSVFVNGTSVGTLNTAPYNAAGTATFEVGTFFASEDFAWPGTIDEVAVWTTSRYTTTFTVPSAPYVGNETGLKCLWHLDGNLNAATVTPLAIGTLQEAGRAANATNSTATTASFTPNASPSRLFATVWQINDNSTVTLATVTDSIGLTWTKQYDTETVLIGSGYHCRSSIWTAEITGAAAAMTVSATLPTNIGGAVSVVQMTNTQAAIINAAYAVSATGDPAPSLPTAPAANSTVIVSSLMNGNGAVNTPTGFTNASTLAVTSPFMVNTFFDQSSPAQSATLNTTNMLSGAIIFEVRPA